MNNFIVYGLGISGISTLKYLVKNNYQVIATDDNQASIDNCKSKFAEFSDNKNLQFTASDKIDQFCNSQTKIIFAPGIPLYHPVQHKIIEIVKKSGAKLMCDVELFFLMNSKKDFLGITGTNGKSTTTALCGFIFDELKLSAKIGGNIGVPCFDLPQVDTYIFETSSYQLDLIDETHFKTAALTNITPDHIDRHGSFEEYVKAKKRIFKNQNENDFAIIEVDNEESKKVYDEFKNDKNFKPKLIAISTKKIVEGGVSILDGILYNTINSNEKFSLSGIILKGEHNMQNIAIAFATVFCYIVSKKINISQNAIVDAIKKFKGLRHRMQFLGNVDGVNFINDSKATNAESTENALKSYENIFWILGGRQKEGGIEILDKYFSRISKAYLIGEASENFAQFLEKNNVNFEKCGDLKTAFNKSFLDAKNSSLKEKNILLSPACASFDQFKNFEERGDQFCIAFDEINKI